MRCRSVFAVADCYCPQKLGQNDAATSGEDLVAAAATAGQNDAATSPEPVGGNLRHTSSCSSLDVWLSGTAWVDSRVELLSSCVSVLRTHQETDWVKRPGQTTRKTPRHGSVTSPKEGHRRFQRIWTTVGNRFLLPSCAALAPKIPPILHLLSHLAKSG